MLPVIVLGGILAGIVTVTEAAALAVFYALFVAVAVNRKITWKDMPDLLLRSQIVAATILFIIAMAKVFTWLVAMKQTPLLVQNAMNALALPPWGLLLVVMIGLLILGCIMETTALLLLFTPLFLPVIDGLGIDRVHFGVVFVLNLMIGTLTPPVGTVMYVVLNISKVKMADFARELWPSLIALTIVLFLITFVPPLVLIIPNYLMGVAK